MTYTAKTREENLHSNIFKKVSKDACQSIAQNDDIRATHVVIGVSYGGSCDIAFQSVSILILSFIINLKISFISEKLFFP